MESKTLSKAETLKALVDMRESFAYKLVQGAAENEVQQCLGVLLNARFTEVPNSSERATSMLGEMRGIRWFRSTVDNSIAQLTAEVIEEQKPATETQKQEDEV